MGAKFRVVLAVLLSALLGCAILLTQRNRSPLRVTITGRTNELQGGSKVLLRVHNESSQLQNYAYWAETSTPTGWTVATNWDAHRPGRMHWIAGDQNAELALSPPEGVREWRLKFMQSPQPSPLQWKWYRAVRQFGLKRIGFGEMPAQRYFYTEPIRDEPGERSGDLEKPSL